MRVSREFVLWWTILCSFAVVSHGIPYSWSQVRFDTRTGGYENIGVIISDQLDKNECPRILENVKVAMTEASRSLFQFLDGRVHLASVNILVPAQWTAADCQTPMETKRPIRAQDGDIFVSPDHPIHDANPWTQQSQGCQRPGDFIYLPESFVHDHVKANSKNGFNKLTNDDGEEARKLADLGNAIRDQWLRYRYGVFGGADTSHGVQIVGSSQFAICYGRSVLEVVNTHPDIVTSRVTKKNKKSYPPTPRFYISNAQPAKYVVVLENSQAMNVKDHWELIRRATKKFIAEDLESEVSVGLVLFNQNAHIAYPVEKLASKQIRDGLTVQIKNKFSLSANNQSCVRCGLSKAMDALSMSTLGMSDRHGGCGTIILISQGKSTSLSLDTEREFMDRAFENGVRIFSLAIPAPPQDDISLSLERLSYSTGGLSFFIPEEAYNIEETELTTYVRLVDAFREIQARTSQDGPYLIHEREFSSHMSTGPLEETGSFVIDKYVGRDTDFNVFAVNRENGFLRSISVGDRRGQNYRGIHDAKASYHILSVYSVPFEIEENIGMNWTYTLERMPSPSNDNKHIVRVTSRARNVGDDIKVKFFTSVDTHAVKVSPLQPIKMFVEVKLRQVPVLDARVIVRIQALNQSGFLMPGVEVTLYDNGNGDPDLKPNDGIYSRYLTDFSGGEGRYAIAIHVDDNEGRAFSFQRIESEGSFNGRSCCLDEDLKPNSIIRNQKLGSFQRIVQGDSFRIPSILNSQSSSLPPARILDLHVDVHTASQQLEFSWTAPGEDFDHGKATSYQLFSAYDPSAFYTNLNLTQPVDGFSATESAGHKESHRITITELNKNIYYAIIAIDKQGNAGEISNVRQAYMPSPSVPDEFPSSADRIHSSSKPEHRLIAGESHKKALVYIAIGIVGFILLCIFLVLLIVISYRRKKLTASNAGSSDPDLSETMRSMGVSTANHGDTHSPGYAVCDDQELVKDRTISSQDTNGYLLGSYSDGQNSVSYANEVPSAYTSHFGTLNSSTYGWTKLNNPYVTQYSSSTLPTYIDFQSQQSDGYVANTFVQPTYAKPLPKNQRQMTSNIYANSPSGSNNNMSNANALQHSTPQSPSGSSSQSSYTHNLASSLAYRQNLANSLMAQNTNNNSSSDERVPSISPPIVESALQSEQIRLISSSSNTPTKSILKKPKHEMSRIQQGSRNNSSDNYNYGDQSSQSSSGSGNMGKSNELLAERLSESSNMSSSDRDTPPGEQTNDASNGPGKPDFSPSNTYLETSFEVKPSPVGPPPTLPKPKLPSIEDDLDKQIVVTANSNTLDRKVRNITQV